MAMPALDAALLPYQAAWVAEPAPFAVCEKSRRIGISYATAAASVLHASRPRTRGGGNVYYQSYSRDNAREFISDCADWAERLQGVAAVVGEVLVALDDGSIISAFRITMASGLEILAMSSAPRQFRSRGRPGDWAIIDEAGHLDDLAEVLKAAMAFIMLGGIVRVMSTHNGEGNAFAQLVRDIDEGARPGALHTITFADAVADGLYRRVVCGAAGGPEWTAAGEAAWVEMVRAGYGADAGEELDCEPAAHGGAWLPWGLIRACEHADAGDPALFGGGPSYCGVDVARRVHLWCATALEEVGDVLWLREIEAAAGVSFSDQEDTVAEWDSRYRFARIAVDQTGMGEKVVEDHQARLGSSRVEGVLLTGGRRLTVATALLERFEDRTIRIPVDDVLRRDLHSIKRAPGATGAPRLVAEGESDGHADRFWSLALGASAASGGRPAYAAHAVDNHAPHRGGRRLGRHGGTAMRSMRGAL